MPFKEEIAQLSGGIALAPILGQRWLLLPLRWRLVVRWSSQVETSFMPFKEAIAQLSGVTALVLIAGQQ